LAAGNAAIGGNLATSLRYFHHDQLGSIAAISEGNPGATLGAVIERLAYDPWGKRRNVNGLSDVTDSLTGLTTDRGFTMHEHLDEMGVVHMNGRIYDPLIGRFMSADPFIQAPSMLQSYNRYSYVMNNPLNLTDPSGFSWWTKIRGFVVTVVAAVADAYGCGGYCSQAVQYYNTAKTAQSYYNAYRQGGWSAVGKSYARSALADYFGQAAFGASGDAGVGQEYGLEHYAATAAAGCVSSVASGSKCGSGAAAAIGGNFATQMTEGAGLNNVTRNLVAQAAGGLAAEAAGGKFANGAQTAAYGYLFNQMAHAGRAAAGAGAGPGGASVQAQNALAVKVDQFFSEIGDQLSYIFKSDSVILARNMAQDAGMSREAGQHAHHIVAAGAALAEPARLILASAGVDINSAFNGIFLDPSQHARIHTNVYYNAVNEVLRGSSGSVDVATRLTGMRVLINAGKFPF
jgi:RHS repeat-associated protein